MRAKRKKRGAVASNSRSSVRVEGSGSIPRLKGVWSCHYSGEQNLDQLVLATEGRAEVHSSKTLGKGAQPFVLVIWCETAPIWMKFTADTPHQG